MLTVSALYIYPVRSLGGISVPSARLTHRGFAYDRRWMLVDEENRFITQREAPKMTLLQTQLHEDCLSIRHRHTGDTLKVPFQPTGDICTVTVWDDTCQGQFVSPEADEWFSDRLSLSCRLVYMPETTLRKVDPNYAHGDEITSFSDGFPLLMIGQAPELLDVVGPEVGGDVVDPDPGLAAPRQPGSHGRAGGGLRGGVDGVLDVEDDLVRAGPLRPVEPVGVVAGDEEPRPRDVRRHRPSTGRVRSGWSGSVVDGHVHVGTTP